MDLAAVKAFIGEYLAKVPSIRGFIDAERTAMDCGNIYIPARLRSADELARHREEFIDLVSALTGHTGRYVNVQFTFDIDPAYKLQEMPP
jgi:hypothetical protein